MSDLIRIGVGKLNGSSGLFGSLTFELKRVMASLLLISATTQVISQTTLSPNGYSGLGMTPSAQTIQGGMAVIDRSSALPGAPFAGPGSKGSTGYNTQVGFGLTDNFEVIGRIATQDQNCNQFVAGACPPGTIRDFSAGLKYSLPVDWLKRNSANVAIGLNDAGGAASLFRSYYMVGGKTLGSFDVSIGAAKPVGEFAALRGGFAALGWTPNAWSKLSLQRIGPDTWASAALNSPTFFGGMSASVNLNRSLNETPLTPRQWAGVSLSIPLDAVRRLPTQVAELPVRRSVKPISPAELAAALKQKGFYGSKIGSTKDGVLVLELENTGYLWNVLDATGVALGVVAAAYGDTKKVFELSILTRGIGLLRASGSAACVKQWLESDTGTCSDLKITTMLQDQDEPFKTVRWEKGDFWTFRPELVLSPALISGVATEVGSLDFDLALNANLVVPLWRGATFEINRLVPTGLHTDDFRSGGAFYQSRLQSGTTRKMLHQILSFPSLSSQARVSLGTAYTFFQGIQLETQTTNINGRHRFGIQTGNFQTDGLPFNNKRSYNLLNYRYSWNDDQTLTTEINQGKFFGGDEGYMISQKFWQGDSNIAIYFRRSKLGEAANPVSFAGLQINIPITPRRNPGISYAGVQGVSQWSYFFETKILETENQITTGFGTIPTLGDSLSTTLNRDRSSTQYFRDNSWRIKNAFVNLTDE
jgi:hypothetical protein